MGGVTIYIYIYILVTIRHIMFFCTEPVKQASMHESSLDHVESPKQTHHAGMHLM